MQKYVHARVPKDDHTSCFALHAGHLSIHTTRQQHVGGGQAPGNRPDRALVARQGVRESSARDVTQPYKAVVPGRCHQDGGAAGARHCHIAHMGRCVEGVSHLNAVGVPHLRAGMNSIHSTTHQDQESAAN